MKKPYTLTEADKIEIVNNLDKFYKELEALTTANLMIISTFGVFGSIIGIIIALFHDPLAFRAIGVGIITSVFSSALVAMEIRRTFKKIVTKKISYSQFKQLEKSGEIARWQNQFKSKTIKCENYIDTKNINQQAPSIKEPSKNNTNQSVKYLEK